MRGLSLMLVALLGTSTAAQTHVDAAVSAGLFVVPETGIVLANSAVQLQAERRFSSTFAVGANLVGLLRASATPNTFAMANSWVDFADLGSSLRISAQPSGWDGGEGLSVELFPFNGVRVRTAFDFANDWGQPVLGVSFAPVVRFGIQRRRWTTWAALRANTTTNSGQTKPRIAWGGLGGFSFLLHPQLRLEVATTLQDRGNNPAPNFIAKSASLLAYGGSARVSWSHNNGVRPALDLVTYAADPERFERFAAPESYALASAAALSLEGGWAAQQMVNPQSSLRVTEQAAWYVDAQARLRIRNLRLFLTGRVRSLTLIVFDQPAFYNSTAFLPSQHLEPHLAGFFGLDYHLAALGLTPGLLVRLIRPAFRFSAPGDPLGGNNPPGAIGNIAVVREAFTNSTLPAGSSVRPVLGVSASLRFEHFAPLTVLTQLDVERDWNASSFQVQTFVGRPVTTVSLTAVAQARF
jgi:hypothetical protein